MGLENPRRFVVKRHYKRDVLSISTKHTSEVSKVPNIFAKKSDKPTMISEYNKWKSATDTSDQML